MKRIFVACSSKMLGDAFMGELVKEIERHGFEVQAPSTLYVENDAPLIDSIRKCGFVLGVIVGNDPNVYFEIGYAMGARKPVLLVCTPSVTLPFDLRAVNCIMAESLSEDAIFRIVDHLKSQRFDENIAPVNRRSFRDVFTTFREDPREFEAVDSDEFCQCVMEWFRHNGMLVHDTTSIKDSGYDFAVERYGSNRKTLVEVRKQSSSSKVSVVQVRALLGVVYAEGADHGILVSASDFTKSAYEFAERCDPKIELWTVENLLSKVD